MPTQLLLDGDDLGALMQRVREELGPDAVVVKAERVRSGGVAGFFAKEHFEVTVEVPDAPRGGQPVRPAGDGAPTGLQALLDAADASDDGGRPVGHPQEDRVAVSTERDTFAALLASIDGMSGGLPAQREPHDRADAPLARAASPASTAAAVPPATPVGDAGDADAPSPVRLVRKGATVTAAAFAPLHRGPDAEPSAAPAAAPAAPSPAPSPAPEPAAESAVPPSAAADRSGVRASTFPRLPAGTVTVPASGGTGRTTPDRGAAPIPTPAAPAAAAPSAEAPAAAPSDGPSHGAEDDAARRARDDATRRALAGVGIPASLLDPTRGAPLSLAGVAGALPRPPALLRAPGSLVAVIGEGAHVVDVAREMARRSGLDPQDVALAGDVGPGHASDREVLTVATAPRQRSRTSTLGTVTVVAVAVGPEVADRRAAAALVAELDPDQCWAVVDARRKASDLRSWMGEVAGGRRFAGLAGTRVAETREPGTLLDAGVPVGWLDGLPATGAVWAAVLGEHLDGGDGRD